MPGSGAPTPRGSWPTGAPRSRAPSAPRRVGFGSPSAPWAPMPTYLVETYTPRTRANHAATTRDLARAAADLVREGVQIEHRRTTLLPDDDTCFYVFEAPSPTAVEEACRRAGLANVRIVGAVET